jgi:Mg-chelatase subunit ChlD
LTQIPPGGHLRTLQHRFGDGTVVLMIDVSPSMAGRPIEEALRGAEGFIAEAVQANYNVGTILWDTNVVAACRPSPDAGESLRVVRNASLGNGTCLFPPLVHCHQMLGSFDGDRVVAIFSDGQLLPQDKSEALRRVAEMKGEDIRFVTRGLGAQAARELDEISDEADGSGQVNSVDDLADGIAGMATALRSRPGSTGASEA